MFFFLIKITVKLRSEFVNDDMSDFNFFVKYARFIFSAVKKNF